VVDSGASFLILRANLMEKITDVLNELGKVTCRDLAGYFDLQPPEMLARLLVLEREGRAKNLNGYWMAGGSVAPQTYNLTALDMKLLHSVPVGVWFSGNHWPALSIVRITAAGACRRLAS
jgi:hypothetical protein